MCAHLSRRACSQKVLGVEKKEQSQRESLIGVALRSRRSFRHTNLRPGLSGVMFCWHTSDPGAPSNSSSADARQVLR